MAAGITTKAETRTTPTVLTPTTTTRAVRARRAYSRVALTALVVVVGVKTVGVVLVSAFVVIPAATANLLGRTPLTIAALAVAFGVGGTSFGLFASYHLNVATGATIILTLGALFFLALVFRRR